jgi:hypothetical protein
MEVWKSGGEVPKKGRTPQEVDDLPAASSSSWQPEMSHWHYECFIAQRMYNMALFENGI